jgi:hypothetical protein
MLELTISPNEVRCDERDTPVKLFALWRIELCDDLVRKDGELIAPRWALTAMRRIALQSGFPLAFREKHEELIA